MDDKESIKGFNCTQCGKYHEYPFYVHAHWNDELTHTCECGAEHTIRRGIAIYERTTNAEES